MGRCVRTSAHRPPCFRILLVTSATLAVSNLSAYHWIIWAHFFGRKPRDRTMPVGVEAWVTQIPPITRAWLAFSVLTSLAVVSRFLTLTKS